MRAKGELTVILPALADCRLCQKGARVVLSVVQRSLLQLSTLSSSSISAPASSNRVDSQWTEPVDSCGQRLSSSGLPLLDRPDWLQELDKMKQIQTADARRRIKMRSLAVLPSAHVTLSFAVLLIHLILWL